MKVIAVLQEDIVKVWPEVEGYMRDAVSYTNGRYEAEDVLGLLYKGRVLWIASDDSGIKGAVVTCLNQYPRKRYLFLEFCGGEDGYTWKSDMLRTLQSWAKDTQCDGIEGGGRLGWERIFKLDGYVSGLRHFELPMEAWVGA